MNANSGQAIETVLSAVFFLALSASATLTILSTTILSVCLFRLSNRISKLEEKVGE